MNPQLIWLAVVDRINRERQNRRLRLAAAVGFVVAVPFVLMGQGQAPSKQPSTRTVDAPALSRPQTAARFELVQLHPNATSYWSGILDTQTGCMWVYASQTPPASPKTSSEGYRAVLGEHFLELVPFDATDYIAPGAPQSTDSGLDFSKPMEEVSRIAALCNKARIRALEAATGSSK